MMRITQLPVHLQAIAASIVILLGLTVTGELSAQQADTLALGLGWALWAVGGLVAWIARRARQVEFDAARKVEESESVWRAYRDRMVAHREREASPAVPEIARSDDEGTP
jgi:hypothetical protein